MGVCSQRTGRASRGGFAQELYPLAVPVADFASLSPTGEGPCMDAGGVQLCATPEYAMSLIHFDAIHANTLYRGLVANAIVESLNAEFGYAMRTIPDDVLLDSAGF